MAQQPIQTSNIEIAINGHSVPAYQCLPVGDGPFPGVIVIQEWWGLEPHIKDITERYAREGYAAVAPDLYHGEVTSEPDEARKLVMALDRPRAVSEVVGTVGYIKSQGFSNGKVGTVGYCMGGGLSIATACNTEDLDAAIIYYGSNPDADQLANVTCPVLGLYGGDDHGNPISLTSAWRWRRTARLTRCIFTDPRPTHSSTTPARVTGLRLRRIPGHPR